MATSNVHWGTHSALQAGANVTVLMVGDSWFWYPFNNLAVETAARFRSQTFLVVGRSGAEASEWATKYRKDILFALDIYGQGASCLMISGGGNDIAGASDFLRLIRDDCSQAQAVADCYRPAQPEATLSNILGHYRALIALYHGHNPQGSVVLHAYDHAWPTGQGVFGPAEWLKVPMQKARVPAKLRRPLFKDLVNRLATLQQQLAQDLAQGPSPVTVVVAATPGVLPDTPEAWANELHPTPKGFKLLVKQAMAPALKAAGVTP